MCVYVCVFTVRSKSHTQYHYMTGCGVFPQCLDSPFHYRDAARGRVMSIRAGNGSGLEGVYD